MRIRASLLLPAALALAGCNSAKNSAPGDISSGAPSASGAPASASTAPSASAHKAAPTREGGSIARAASDDALYVADEDQGVIRRIPLPFDTHAESTMIRMPGLPAQVLALDDRVLVTIRSEGAVAPGATTSEEPANPAAKGAPDTKTSRIPVSPTGSGLLLIMRPDAAAGLVEVGRVALPADAWGIAITPDEKTALVSSAWTHQVSAIDLATAKKLWSIDVPREPRAIVIRPDGTSAYVTHLVGGAITRIDDITGQPKAHPITLPPSPLRSPSGKTLDGTLAYSAALSADGSRFFVARHAIGALGEASWFGAATVDVLLTKDDTPLAPKRDVALPRGISDAAAAMRSNSSETKGTFPRIEFRPFSAPRAMAYRKKSASVFVASEGTNQVVEFDARVVDPTMFVRRTFDIATERDELIPVAKSGGAPSGLAFSEDESILYVYCRTTHDIVELKLENWDPKNGYARVHLAGDLLADADAKGRRIFYDASDELTSGGVSCNGCHPEGRDDGHIWHEATITTRSGEATNFLGDADQAPRESTKAVGYARQTPMLAGRVASKGPYGWHAESPELVDRLKAGLKLHRWGQLYSSYGDGPLLGRAQHLTLFLRHGLVPPPRDAHELTKEEARGKEIFMSEQARCGRCHVPETEYTDRTAYPLFPKLAPVARFEEDPNQNFKTPSLLYVAGTAPYFHDGRASTLEVLIEQNNDRMGRTSHLSPEDRAALVAFLRTL